MWCRFGSDEDAKNAWNFSMAFTTEPKYAYPKYDKQSNFSGPFVECHLKSYSAIRGAKVRELIGASIWRPAAPRPSPTKRTYSYIL